MVAQQEALDQAPIHPPPEALGMPAEDQEEARAEIIQSLQAIESATRSLRRALMRLWSAADAHGQS